MTDVCELNLGMWRVYLTVYNARRFYNLCCIFWFAYMFFRVCMHNSIHTCASASYTRSKDVFPLKRQTPGSIFQVNPDQQVTCATQPDNDRRIGIGTFRRHSHLMIMLILAYTCSLDWLQQNAYSNRNYRHFWHYRQRDGIPVLMICTHMCHLYM